MKDFKKKPICKKCGGKNIAISYHFSDKEDNNYDCGLDQDCRWLTKEHMAHHCRTCSYEWTTKVFSPIKQDDRKT